MNEVTPWISDYFLNLAIAYGSNYNTAPLAERPKKCQLKRVLTSEPKDYIWVILSDQRHEIPGRIPKEVVEECLKAAKRDGRFTRHTGSLIDIRDFTPLFIRVEDGPSTSAPRKVLGLEIRKARLRGAAGETIWGTPQPLDSVPELKEWLHELRKPDGNQDILKIRKKQQVEGQVKQFTKPSEPLPDPGLHLRPATYAPTAAMRKGTSTTSNLSERSPMQRYRRKWHKAVPGLGELAQRLQIPEDERLKILEKQTNKKTEANTRSLGTVHADRPLNTRGALEIGSSPPRLSSVPRATTPTEWPASPGVLRRLYDDRETDMSSDVDSSRPPSPTNVCHDAEMHEIEPQPESETVPETPQVVVIVDSQSQRLSPPPPAQPPRPRSPLPSSSNPQMQNAPTSSGSIHTSIQAVSGSQLPSFENPPTWTRLDDEPSNGPSFELPWSQKPPSKATKKPPPTPTPSPLDRLAEIDHSKSPVRQPFQALNRKVPVPEVGPTREPIRGRSENGVPTMVLIPASDDTKWDSVAVQVNEIPRSPSPLPREGRNSAISSVPQSAKGKERAKGIKGLEKINAPEDIEREEPEVVQVQVKKKAPDTGSKRKPSDAFSAQDDSRETKRQKVVRDEPRKPTKQPSFVDPSKLKSVAPTRAQRSKPGKDVEKDSVVPEFNYPPARKLGSFAPDLNPPPLPGIPGGRLMNKQLREILIRTGKVRVKEAKAAESNQNGRRR